MLHHIKKEGTRVVGIHMMYMRSGEKGISLVYQFHISFGVQHEVFCFQVLIQDPFVMEVCKGFNHTLCYEHSYILLEAPSAT